MEKKLNDLIDKALSRRQFMAGAGTTAAAVMVAGCNSSTPAPTTTPTPSPTPLDIPDNDILNFALNLEYLEAEFYLYATTGAGLSSTDAGSGAGSTVLPPNFAPVVWGTTAAGVQMQQFANELAQTELDHVRYLQATITANKGTPISRPAIDLSFFAGLATAAGITTPAPFTPFASPNAFLIGGFTFEDVGVTAYTGAAPLLASNIILSGAAGIQAAESYHSGAIRTMLVGGAATANDQTYVNIANQVSALRAKISAGSGNMNQAETSLTTTSIVAADPVTAIAFPRTTDQVMHIVYGGTPVSGAGVSKGGFFPNGLNGNISVTAS